MLMILDGFGVCERTENNAVKLAKTPFLDSAYEKYPHTTIHTNGVHVGLPGDVMGNSEVGHLNLGAGRIVWQEVMRISNSIHGESFFKNEALVEAVEHVRVSGGKFHVVGLLSDAYVHSVEEHYFALVDLCRRVGMKKGEAFFHAFMDGRDTPPKSGRQWMQRLQDKLAQDDIVQVASLQGRYFGMDRDKRWDRVEKCYRLWTRGEGLVARDPIEAIEAAYGRGETDEFVSPTFIAGEDGKPLALFEDDDAFVFFNFRGDRPREISHAFLDDEFPHFPRDPHPKVFHVSMTDYDASLRGKTHIAFPQRKIEGLFGEALAKAGLTQLRIAETEKYAHVTYFFNGGEEQLFPGEERILVASPKVATYDLQPEMSAYEVTDKLLAALDSGRFDVIVLNFANCDMVGHTGKLDAAIKALESLDGCIERIAKSVLSKNGEILLTADHGNAEEMWNYEEDSPHTQHTTNPVPLIFITEKHRSARLRDDGSLCDVTPTMCDLLGIEKTPQMEGSSLILP
ncbi:MAG: 2,3-bisphosphoglycerate-independent phosphoglycerate mutase [Planctomycetes bacterium]|nr:2,3-bisphosphoglycerate-independent phosphoglycerate mutase [Planctomycetota bacterium]